MPNECGWISKDIKVGFCKVINIEVRNSFIINSNEDFIAE